MDDLSGQVIRGYEILERVGAGGFGVVYRAFQLSVRREVAFKAILPQRAEREEFIRRFETEAHLVARLEHPHIVPLYDFWREPDGNIYLVMRWLRGGSLRDLLRHGPLPFDTTARIADHIGEALAVAHQAGIIHRDLKPDNILFDERQNAYLTDFGIAKETFNPIHITTTGRVPITPAYAAPEHFAGQPVTPLTDIYSFGLTLFECLVGEHPFPTNPRPFDLNHAAAVGPSFRHNRMDYPRC